jgi:hypothetical protein
MTNNKMNRGQVKVKQGQRDESGERRDKEMEAEI